MGQYRRNLACSLTRLTCNKHSSCCRVAAISHAACANFCFCSLPSSNPCPLARTQRSNLDNNWGDDIPFMRGTIPTEIGELSLLTSYLSPGNKMTGTIPTEVGRLTRMGDLSPNVPLTGQLPSELGELTVRRPCVRAQPGVRCCKSTPHHLIMNPRGSSTAGPLEIRA